MPLFKWLFYLPAVQVQGVSPACIAPLRASPQTDRIAGRLLFSIAALVAAMCLFYTNLFYFVYLFSTFFQPLLNQP